MYQAYQALHASRAFGYILREHNLESNLAEYLEALAKTTKPETDSEEAVIEEGSDSFLAQTVSSGKDTP